MNRHIYRKAGVGWAVHSDAERPRNFLFYILIKEVDSLYTAEQGRDSLLLSIEDLYKESSLRLKPSGRKKLWFIVLQTLALANHQTLVNSVPREGSAVSLSLTWVCGTGVLATVVESNGCSYKY